MTGTAQQLKILSNEFYRGKTALEFAHCYNGDTAENEDDGKDWLESVSAAIKKSVEKNLSRKKCGSKSLRPPSLTDICLWILVEYADSISSLNFVPDVLRRKISRKLCESGKMNNHVLNLLLCGSPTEVCLSDCSWLSREEFIKNFQGCDTSRLTTLQLDQCGRFILDCVLLSTLAQSSNSLPALTSFSLTGACRLSDIGIAALVSSAPALQSLNLRQCTFLTSSSIDAIANSLGSTLRELYLDDCQNMVPMLMISAMKKLQQLEVLSLAGIETVCDKFIQEFLTAAGHNLKELILANCVKLTKKSIEVITENCPALCALDLVNLSMLDDFALCRLSSCYPNLQKLKLSQNLYSDLAVAAFVENSGWNLIELSLNGVNRVSSRTAISLANFSKNLVSLDVSWCKKLTNETLCLTVSNCHSLRELKLFGCSQVTDVRFAVHLNPEVEIIGLKLSPIWPRDALQNSYQALSDHFSSVPSSFA